MRIQLLGAVFISFAIVAYGTPALEISTVSSFAWKYDDKGTGADSDVSVWSPTGFVPGFYSLGDVAMPMYDRAPSSVVAVKALVSGALMPPTGFTLVWTDSGSGGDNDAAFWRPNPPTGYTCLGHVQNLGGTPSTDSIRCVKTEYVVAGTSQSVWNDAGSGANDDCGVWLAKPLDLQSEALPTNTFISRQTHDVGSEQFYLINKNFVSGLGYATIPTTYAEWEQVAQDFAPHVWLPQNEVYQPSSVADFLPNVNIGTSFMTLKEAIGDHDTLNDNVQPLVLRGSCTSAAPCRAPMYAIIVDKTSGARDIVYFFFYPYNRGKYMSLSPFYSSTYYGDHVGDWEHYTVRFYNGHPYQLYLSAHGDGVTELFNSAMVESMTVNSHTIYSAWGSHAAYLLAGSHTYKTIGPWELIDETNKGTQWLPFALHVIWRQALGSYSTAYDWMNYSGRWGNPESACIDDINLGFTTITVGVCRLENGPTGPMDKNALDPTYAGLD